MVTWFRASKHIITTYNGKEHLPIYITNCMVGHKLSKFTHTLNFKKHAKNDNTSHC